MKKFFAGFIIPVIMFMVISCYDDTDDECDEAPASCVTSAPSSGTLNFNVTIDSDNPTVTIYLRSGSDYDTGSDVDTIITSATSNFGTYPTGEYSAMVTYTVVYKGTTYTVEAVDGVDLSYSSDDYCDGITCYEEGSETFELEFDRDAFIAKLKGSGKECFIATAAYGSGDAWQVEYLRSFRDRVLRKHAAGRFFIRQYYAYSPAAAEFISGRPAFGYTVSVMLTAMIYAMMHPYIFAASCMAFISAVLLVYALAIQRRRKNNLPRAC